jgi:molybdopterin/thiamine biosynthesis adenylyltransferase/rhodanese-related sulfurtransferase
MDTKKVSYERYERQMLLPQLGRAGQEKLHAAKVLVVGAGGLGCPALQYLVAVGVGTIGIADGDIVSLNNLHRQVLYNMQDIGLPKVERAASALQQLNPDTTIITCNERLTAQNALDIIPQFDIVVDGTDNFSSRYLINDACVLLGKPLVYGAVSRFEGQVSVFNYEQEPGVQSANYRDLFPQPPDEGEVRNCAETGVLGVLPGIIGAMQANETIKLITGIGQPLVNRLLTYNALNNQTYEVVLLVSNESSSLIPSTADLFRKMDYESLCSTDVMKFEINSEKFDEWIEAGSATIIDVREMGEYPEVTEFLHVRVPFSGIKEELPATSDTIIVFCQSGTRSLQVAQYLSGIFSGTKEIYSLQGGILQWKKMHQRNPV